MAEETVVRDLSELDDQDIASDGVDQRALEGREFVQKTGFYHLIVRGADAQVGENGLLIGLKLNLQVLGGDQQTEVGGKLVHYINLLKKDGSPVSDVLKKSNARIARALGLVTDAEILSGRYRARWSTAQGRQFFAKIAVKDARAQIDFGQAWKPGDEMARRIPADVTLLAAANYPIDGQIATAAVVGQCGVGTATAAVEDGAPF